MFALRYLPSDPFGRSGAVVGSFSTREDAETIRRGCPNGEHIEVISA